MRIAVISTYTHPTRLRIKERSVMQSAVPELVAALCPDHAEVEIYNEKEADIPLDRHWDLVFFSYLHSYYEHTKILSTIFRRRGMTTVAGGRHATYFAKDVSEHFDAVVVGQPEANVPQVVHDFEQGKLKKIYDLPPVPPEALKPYRYDLIDFKTNPYRLPGIEASRGCPFSCNFCVLTGHEKYIYRPVDHVIDEIRFKMAWNKNYLGLFDNAFLFLDNNLGGSPRYLKELCEALVPLKKTWGCALTFNILRRPDLVHLMAKAGCRYIYTGLESLNPASIDSMNKGQNRLEEVAEVIRRVFSEGILLSFGLIVGADGDSSEYLERLPEYLADVGAHAITYLGLVCPYPETPYFRQLQEQGRLFEGTISRDYDGYTLCHHIPGMSTSEVIEHYRRLADSLTSLRSIARHYWSKAFMSHMPRYRTTIAVSGREIASMKHPFANRQRTFIAGQDPIEEWDATQAAALQVPYQYIT